MCLKARRTCPKPATLTRRKCFRTLCVVTDAPAQLLRGLAELPRFESELSLLPRALGFLNGIKLVRTVGTFATQYWFYEQLTALGHSGNTQVDMGVMAATKAQTKAANAWLAQRRALIAGAPRESA